MDGLAYLHYALVWDDFNGDQIANVQQLLAIALVISLLSQMSPTLGNYVWQLGDYGPAVVELQDRLKAVGCFPGSTRSTGYYGPITTESVKALQAAQNIAIDGMVGVHTQALLDRGLGCYIQEYSSILNVGSQGDRVGKLQIQLNNWGVPPEPGGSLKVDGIFGPETQKSVIRFQEFKGLKVDGIVGPETSQALWEPRLNAEQQRLFAEFKALAVWLCEDPQNPNDLEHKRIREEMLWGYSNGDRRLNWEDWSKQWCRLGFNPQNPDNWGGIYQGYMGQF
ncbi:peptidoglycan-binding protein [Roseofilum reptotaenium CS-1145]|uniref:Peptidoglycan binding-like domain-containing protein n=1 Tax=Roseofilum reptotaenium AO1-A TaxID=1925591 RepID=A0A1L9QNU3_9CYAN|nr:peptidoglycan-binding protein [Roseofilum reptotaenium]MDB9519360.1 peptidoglycan-binding protein [Roseofilum reptotaenium CS-1145]OJJ24341.1 hypothetical protein BI308_17310 [Roseofilum reptotaenium AO1-A]